MDQSVYVVALGGGGGMHTNLFRMSLAASMWWQTATEEFVGARREIDGIKG